MKSYLLSILLLFPVFVDAQVHFDDGASWKTLMLGSSSPQGEMGIAKNQLDGDTLVGDFTARKLYEVSGNVRSLLATIRTEKEKVYFKLPDRPDWYLMYDFGLTPGTGCDVYSILDAHRVPYKSYVKCVALTENDDQYNGWDTMTLEEYETADCECKLGTGTWIQGLASTLGVLQNSMFAPQGGTSELLEASLDGEVLYTHRTTGITEISASPCNVRMEGYDVYVKPTSPQTAVCLYSAEGVLLEVRKTSEEEVHLVLPGQGMYILKCGLFVQKLIAW